MIKRFLIVHIEIITMQCHQCSVGFLAIRYLKGPPYSEPSDFECKVWTLIIMYWDITLCLSQGLRGSFKTTGTMSMMLVYAASNQNMVVAFMCITLDTSSIFTKKKIKSCEMFLIPVMLRWHSGIKNHAIRTFKVCFLCQKSLFNFLLSLKKINWRPQFLVISISKSL